jgi:hypothetical protein
VTPARAAGFTPSGGPWCILLTNFCDSLSVSTSNDANRFIYGSWDWTCSGNWIPVLGNVGPPPVTVGGQGLPYIVGFVWHVAPMTFDLWATDGTAMFQFQNDQPFTFTPGKCSGAPVNGLAPLLGNKE